MVLINHILVDDELKKFIEKNKKYDRETSNSVLKRLLKTKLKGGLKNK